MNFMNAMSHDVSWVISILMSFMTHIFSFCTYISFKYYTLYNFFERHVM